jgi:hypothetical protein
VLLPTSRSFDERDAREGRDELIAQADLPALEAR